MTVYSVSYKLNEIVTKSVKQFFTVFKIAILDLRDTTLYNMLFYSFGSY